MESGPTNTPDGGEGETWHPMIKLRAFESSSGADAELE